MKLLGALVIFLLTNIGIAKGQLKDSININKPPIRSQLFVPFALMISGISVNGNSIESFKKEVAEERSEHFPHFHTSIDNYLQYSPIAIAYALDAMGVKSKNDLRNRTAILLKGELAMIASVSALKY